MEGYLWFLAIPVIGIVSPIYLSFDRSIKPINKVLLFLLLPIVEMLFSILAIVESLSKNTNLTDTWQLQVIVLLIIFGLSLSLTVALVKNIDRTIKFGIRLIALSIFSFVIVWGILSLS